MRAFHDEAVRNVATRKSSAMRFGRFVYAKQKNVATAKAAPEGAGDVWTWTALDSDTKLILSWLGGRRDIPPLMGLCSMCLALRGTRSYDRRTLGI